jgi:hypothetical protein
MGRKRNCFVSRQGVTTVKMGYCFVESAAFATVMQSNLNLHARGAVFALLVFGISTSSDLFSQSPAPVPAPHAVLERHYQEGEKLAYKMIGVNQGHQRTVRYEAHAEGAVKKSPAGAFYEELAWSGLQVNGQPFSLSPASTEFRESLSLTPSFPFVMPDLSKVQPILIGPITDLLTFYADGMLTMQQKCLVHAGDHVYVKN